MGSEFDIRAKINTRCVVEQDAQATTVTKNITYVCSHPIILAIIKRYNNFRKKGKKTKTLLNRNGINDRRNYRREKIRSLEIS